MSKPRIKCRIFGLNYQWSSSSASWNDNWLTQINQTNFWKLNWKIFGNLKQKVQVRLPVWIPFLLSSRNFNLYMYNLFTNQFDCVKLIKCIYFSIVLWGSFICSAFFWDVYMTDQIPITLVNSFKILNFGIKWVEIQTNVYGMIYKGIKSRNVWLGRWYGRAWDGRETAKLLR